MAFGKGNEGRYTWVAQVARKTNQKAKARVKWCVKICDRYSVIWRGGV